MRLYWITLVLVLAMFSLARQALATPSLPITDGLLYQLDATDSANLLHDPGTGAITSWASSAGSATGFAVAPTSGRTGATYSATGGGNNNLTNVVFSLGSVLVQSGGPATTPQTVFIMENTTGVDKYGGILGRYNRDRGIRFGVDNPDAGSIYGGPAVVGTNLYDNLGPAVAGGTHQLINGVHITEDALGYGTPPYSLNPYNPYRKTSTTVKQDFGLNDEGLNGQGGVYTENYYWSDNAIFDGRQTWQNKNWGTLGAYAYDNYAVPTWIAPGSGYGCVALGAYNGASRGWAGGIGEVLVYDRWLSAVERQSVETYLQSKWLAMPSPILKAVPDSGTVINLGTLVPNASVAQTITLSNTGDATSTINVTSGSFPDGSLFSFDPAFAIATLTAGTTASSKDYFVKFNGTAQSGHYSDTLTFLTSVGGPTVYTVTADVLHDGDANGDGTVNFLDYNIVKTNYLSNGVGWAGGDLNGDGTVNFLDYNIVKTHYLHTSATIGVQAVPEPATLSLLAIGGLAMLRKRRK